jgi:hypothetical protein
MQPHRAARLWLVLAAVVGQLFASEMGMPCVCLRPAALRKQRSVSRERARVSCPGMARARHTLRGCRPSPLPVSSPYRLVLSPSGLVMRTRHPHWEALALGILFLALALAQARAFASAFLGGVGRLGWEMIWIQQKVASRIAVNPTPSSCSSPRTSWKGCCCPCRGGGERP